MLMNSPVAVLCKDMHPLAAVYHTVEVTSLPLQAQSNVSVFCMGTPPSTVALEVIQPTPSALYPMLTVRPAVLSCIIIVTS